MATKFRPEDVLDFWFPDNGHWNSLETHGAYWNERMQGGMDAAICERFGPLTEAAAQGLLDHWADTPRGRLALIIALDQFPRSYWRNTPGAYAQDIKATCLVMEALENGHYDALENGWERQFLIIALTHCEGPDHLTRMKLAKHLSEKQVEILPEVLSPLAGLIVDQAEKVNQNIVRFGRHPHRNAVLGRMSTKDEEDYLAKGIFPHERQVEST